MAARYYIMVLLLVQSLKYVAQSDSAAVNAPTESYFNFNYENDFFSATDRYYTQGITLSFIHSAIRYSPLSYTLLKLKNARHYYGLHAQQDVFTPRSIRYQEGAIYYGERPFTAVFFLSHSLTSLNPAKKTLLHSQLDLGILGPEALGEQEQKGIHKALDNIEPQGWDNQLSTDYIVNYRVKAEKGIINKKHFELMASVNARLGTLYTDAGVGLQFRIGLFNPYFNNLGMEKNASQRKNDFRIYFTGKMNGKLVGYNATLQGGVTNSGNIYQLPASAVTRAVGDLYAGISLSYKRVNVEYARTYITPEFKEGLDHGWGRCLISVCF